MKLKQELIGLIESEIEKGYISRKKHPIHDIWILNYTPKCQFEWRWNEATKLCRGLVVDEEYNIVARSYPKFFSYEQIEDKSEIPTHESFTVSEKLDGSLLLAFVYKGEIVTATRGCFDSPQAKKGLELLLHKYNTPTLWKDVTYLFEIIYPENRIIVDYGSKEKLVLHGMYETRDVNGELLPTESLFVINSMLVEGLEVARLYRLLPNTPVENILKEFPYDGGEGFVIRYESGYRVKLKYEEYKQMAHLMMELSNKKVIDMALDGSINDVLDSLPEPRQSEVRLIASEVQNRRHGLETQYECYIELKKVVLGDLSGKEWAELFIERQEKLSEAMAKYGYKKNLKFNTALAFAVLNKQEDKAKRIADKMIRDYYRDMFKGESK